MPDQVNLQVTDAVTQTNTKVISEGPAYSIALAYQVLAHSVGHVIQNGTAAQQNVQTIAAATAAKSVEMISRIDVG